MTIGTANILTGLWIAVAIMLIVVLYHLLFVAVDLRKILRRIEGITSEVEGVIMKPLSMIDSILEWVMENIERNQKKKEHKKEVK